MTKALKFVEAEIDYCEHEYGVLPCTASLSSSPPTGTQKCLNCRSTCQDLPNFSDVGETIRFAENTTYLPGPEDVGDVIPSLINVEVTPAIISLGENLGQRATIRATFKDQPHSDAGPGFDKYVDERDYDPWEQGSFWPKFHARHPYLLGRDFRVIRGELGDDIEDMDTRHYITETTDGPTPQGVFSLVAKDVLKLADTEKAVAPALNTGTLAIALTAADTTMEFAPPGIANAEYPTSGKINLGNKEIVTYVRPLNATFLLHGDGADNGTTFTDSAGSKTVTRSGQTITETSQFKFGTAAIFFDQVDDALFIASHVDFQIGTGDFIVDFWVRFASSPASQCIVDWRSAGGDTMPTISTGAGTTFLYFVGGVVRITGTTGTVANTWYHVMVSRAGGITRLFLNGVQDGSSYTTVDNFGLPGSNRPIWGTNTSAANDFGGWLDEFRYVKGQGRSAGFTVPSAAYVIATGDVAVITRAQDGTEADEHDAEELVQMVLDIDPEDPSTIIADLLEDYANVPAEYINRASWLAETENFRGTLYSATIANPTSINKLVSELIEQAALALWWDDSGRTIKLQALRAIGTDAFTFTEDHRLGTSLNIVAQPQKRVSRVTTYFAPINPLVNLDKVENYQSSIETIDTESEENYGAIAGKIIYSRWIPFGGSATAELLNNVQIARFKNPPRKVTFDLLKYAGTDPELGGGYKISAPMLQDAWGVRSDMPVQVISIDTDTVIQVEAEEMNFDTAEDEGERFVIIDTSANNLNFRTIYDANYVTPVGGDIVNFVILAGVIIGSVSTALPAFESGSWPGGVTINLRGGGRIQGAGGKGGDWIGFSGTVGLPGGTALKTTVAINMDMEPTGQIWGGGGGGGVNLGSGGGGGQGSVPGLGGSNGGSNASTEAPGTPLGGAEGTAGGNGSLANGGAAGAAIDGHSLITYVNSPEIDGGQIN